MRTASWRSVCWRAVAICGGFCARASVVRGCMVPVRYSRAGRGLHSPHQVHASRPAQRRTDWPSFGSGPNRAATCSGASAAQRLAPDPVARLHRHRDQALRLQPRLHGRRIPRDREWSAKFPPEAPTEVAASRIVWGVGYPSAADLLPRGVERREGARRRIRSCPRGSARRRPSSTASTRRTPWSYYQNPFVGTRELNGLLVLQAMLGNSDLKDQQNVIYELEEPFEGAEQWYVARDLGQTFGRTGVIDAPRGDPAVFEQTPFIKGVAGRQGAVRLPRPPPRAVREHHACRRAMDLPAAAGGSPTTQWQRRVPRRWLSRRRSPIASSAA